MGILTFTRTWVAMVLIGRYYFFFCKTEVGLLGLTTLVLGPLGAEEADLVTMPHPDPAGTEGRKG
jgi:hypothetical protein